jgi:hypothetical protein
MSSFLGDGAVRIANDNSYVKYHADTVQCCDLLCLQTHPLILTTQHYPLHHTTKSYPVSKELCKIVSKSPIKILPP